MRKRVTDEQRAFARAQRRNPTEAEGRLWMILRDKRLGYKFDRQQPLEGYVVDFVCHETRLVIEADGAQHLESEHDARRDAALAAAGYRTLRFWNAHILNDLDGVAVMIGEALRQRLGPD